MAIQQFGVSPQGFVVKQQQTIITEMSDSLRQAFGTNINLLPQAVFGQIINVLSEREALLWQIAEAVYSSQYPSGAEGTSVDNILALNNLKRLPARATVTAPTSTAGIPGLTLLGTAGTIIPAGSIISVNGSPTTQFTTDAAITIAAAVNAVQVMTLYGGVPTTGSFSLQITDPSGNVLTTAQQIPWNANAATTQISWTVAPTSGQFIIAVGDQLTVPILYSDNAATIQTAIQALTGYGAVTVTGSPSAGPIVINWGTVSQPVVSLFTTKLAFSANPSAGTIQISLNGNPAAAVAYNASAATLQAAINDVAGFELVTVTGSATLATGFYLDWGWVTPPTVLVTVQPTGATVSVVATETLDQTPTAINSVQAYVNTLYDSTDANYPFTDVTATGSLASGTVTFTFGNGTVVGGQPSSGAQAQELLSVPNSTVQADTTVVNFNVATATIGAPAEGIGSATCFQTGPIFVPAGQLSVIGSPVSGWASVTNPLDCITGANIETDIEALTRRFSLLSAQANGPLEAIREKVSEVQGVVQAVGFENVSLAAEQTVTFVGTPIAGFFTLTFIDPSGSPQTTVAIPWNAQANVQVVKFSGVPPSGSFTLTFGTQTTAPILYSATSIAVQSAIRALTGYETVIVTGSYTLGFSIANGTHPQLPAVANNSLGGGVTISVIHSVQALVNDLTSYFLAIITGSFMSGFEIAFNGSAGGQPQALVNAINALTGVASITVAFGRPGKSFEIVVNDNNGQAQNQDIIDAIYKSKPAGIYSYGTTSGVVVDAFGNAHVISFSRPTQVPIYIVITLVTDLTTSPTPKFNPSFVSDIQRDLVEIGEAFPVGGLIVGFGSNGLIGAFNSVPGITSYTLAFGTAPNPVSNSNIQLQPEQVGQFESFLVLVSFT